MSAAPLPSNDERDRLLGEAIDGYLERLRQGEPITPEAWIDRFPDLADELRDCLSALDLMKPSITAPPKFDHDRKEPPMEAEDAALPRIAGYAVLQEISRGGMGIVYKAIQLSTKRVVAVKLISGELASSPPARRRFEREIELAAGLDHSGIVRVYESGGSEAGVYCAMEYVTGRTLHEYLSQTNLSITEKLRLFLEIVEAVQYAHLRGVVHRDLKPSNIMVDANCRPRILDFGLARLTRPAATQNESGTLVTREGQLIGTLPYLSPEHAAGKGRQIDVRSDIYALGVILYEMLSGRLPYDTSGPLDEALHNICHTVPPRPSQFTTTRESDLDAVVLKALEKSPDVRYQSAAQLAEEIRCHLRGEPVEANRTGSFYLLRKAYARHRTGVRIASGAMILVLLFSAVILFLFLQVRRDRNRLADELHASQLRRAVAHLAAGHDILAERLLWPPFLARPTDPQALWSLMSYYIANPLIACRASRDVGWVTCAAFSPDGRFAVFGNLSGQAGILDPISGELNGLFDAHPGASITTLAVISEGRELVTGGTDGAIKVWRLGTGQSPRILNAHPGGVTRVCFSTRTKEMISCGQDRRVLLWRNLSDSQDPTVVFQSPRTISAADFSRNGELLAIGDETGMEILDPHTTTPRAGSLSFPNPVEAVRFSPNGTTLAVWSGGHVQLIDPCSLKPRWIGDAGLAEPRPTSLWNASPTPHWCWTPSMDFSDDGSLLICSSWGAAVRVWNTATGRNLGDLRAHETAVYAVAFQPGSHRFLAGCVQTLRIWDLDLHSTTSRWALTPPTEHTYVALSPNGGLEPWALCTDGAVRAVTKPTLGEADLGPVLAGGAQSMAIDSVNGRLAVADAHGEVALWDIASRHRLRMWAGKSAVRSLAFSQDGSCLAAGDWQGRIRVWDCGNGVQVGAWNAHDPGIVLALAFSPDGTQIFSGGSDFHARLWRISDSSPLPLIDWRHNEWVNAVAFSPDGTRMASGGADLGIFVGPAQGSPEVKISPAHAHWVNALAFLDDGNVLVSGGNDEALRFWDARTGQDLAVLLLGYGPIHSLAASKDGHLLAVGAAKSVQLIDLQAAYRLIEHQFQKGRHP